MNNYILGVSSFYHDSAAAITRNGEIIAAAQEERFTRKKHDPRLPKSAINYCLEEAFIEADELTAVIFYDNVALTIERGLSSIISGASDLDNHNEVWNKSARSLLGIKPFISEMILDYLGVQLLLLT